MLKTVTLKCINQQLFIQKCLKYHKTYRDSTEGAHFYTILRRGEKQSWKQLYKTEMETTEHSIILTDFSSLTQYTWATATFMEHAWQAAAHR